MVIKRGYQVILLFLFICFFTFSVSAEVIGIDVKEKSSDEFNFRITLYDNSKNKIDGQLNYTIQNFYSDLVQEGKINSGDNLNFTLPKNPFPYQGPWKINVRYGNIEAGELFNVGDVKRADLRLEGDNLVIENTGNVPYDKKVLVSINEEYQTIQVYLSVGQTKNIKLTAPDGKYSVKVDDGENQISQTGVSLTGNVVGVESVIEGNFWSKYPLVALFLIALIMVFFIVSVLKIHNRLTNKKINIKKKRK